MKLLVKNVTKHYGKTLALCNFDAEFTVGVNAILGPNGAGKSTLISLITGNTTRETGSILYNDCEILKLGAVFRSIIGYMPQSQGLYDQMTAFGFLNYMAALKGVPKKRATQEISKLLELVGLTQRAHDKLGDFSGGMRQRISFAQSLIADPKILILDEPTAGLDPEERVRLRNHITELSKDKIILICTHIASDIEQIADRLLLIKDGRAIFSGTQNDMEKTAGSKGVEKCYIELMHRGEAHDS